MADEQQPAGRDFATIITGLSQGLQATKNPAYFVNTPIQSIPLLSTCYSPAVLDFNHVDVGGGRGHVVRGLAAKYPNENARIELVGLEFFQTQPVNGADVYYLHKNFHDWPDKDCVRILHALREAMEPHSRVLICDFILPDKGCSLLQTAFDIDMLSLHSGAERDEEMWKRVIAKADGVKLVKLWQSPREEGEGIVELALA